MKKLFIIFLFITALAPLALLAQTDPVQVITPGTVGEVITNPCQEGAGEYCLLEPIPFGDGNLPFSKIDSGTGLGEYLQTLFKILLGIIGVLAVVMIIVGGVQYMTTDAIGGKENGKETVTNALGGLILALGSWLILNTINPDLVSFKLDVKEVAVEGVVYTLPAGVETVYVTQEALSLNENNGTGRSVGASGSYEISGTAYTNPLVSDADCAAIPPGYGLKDIVVQAVGVGSPQNTAAFLFKDASGNVYSSCRVRINIGANGVAQAGAGVAGDKKTPIGLSVINSDRRLSTGLDQPVMTANGQFNMGAAFVNTGIGINAPGDRYIGFHGMKTNKLGSTAGCIRMYNDDLLALYPFMQSGIRVIIVNSFSEYNQRTDKVTTIN